MNQGIAIGAVYVEEHSKRNNMALMRGMKSINFVDSAGTKSARFGT